MKRKHRLTRQHRRYPALQRRDAVAERVRGRLRIFGLPVYEIVNMQLKSAYMTASAQLAIASYFQQPRYRILGPEGLTPEDFDAV